MRAVFTVLLGLASVILCSGQKLATVNYNGLTGVVVYNNGYLLSWDSPHYTQFSLYDQIGKLVYFVPARRDDSSAIMWAVDSDGVAAGAFQPRHLMQGRIDLLDSFGNVQQTINTGSHIPHQVIFAHDHSIWTAGYDVRSDGGHDFNVLHHYARTGEELGQALPWSKISSDFKHPVIDTMLGGQLLHMADDRIGWNAALHIGSRTWIEVSFSGELLAEYELKTVGGLALWPLAMTANGSVYAKISTKDSRFFGLVVLDRSQGVWNKLIGYPAGMLIGSKGDDLVFAQQDGDLTTLHFVPSKGLRSEPLQDTAEVSHKSP